MRARDVKVNMKVRIKENAKKFMPKGSAGLRAGWVSGMDSTLGTVGTVVRVPDSDGDIRVKFHDGDVWWYNIRCIEPEVKPVVKVKEKPVATVAPQPEVRYRTGMVFKNTYSDGKDVYLLSQVDVNKIVFVSFNTGNRFTNPVTCSADEITPEIIKKMNGVTGNFVPAFASVKDMVAGRPYTPPVAKKRVVYEVTKTETSISEYASKEEFEGAFEGRGFKFVKFVD